MRKSPKKPRAEHLVALEAWTERVTPEQLKEIEEKLPSPLNDYVTLDELNLAELKWLAREIDIDDSSFKREVLKAAIRKAWPAVRFLPKEEE